MMPRSTKKVLAVSAAIALFAVGCSNPKKASDGNFKRAINQYLAENNNACVHLYNRAFPLNIPAAYASIPNYKSIGSQLDALESHGLLSSTNTTAVVSNPFMLTNPKPEAVRQYTLTNRGEKAYRNSPSLFMAKNAEFCYGQESVNSIVKWTEPGQDSTAPETVVTFTYKVDNMADWANEQDVQHAFPELAQTLNNAKTQELKAPLQLTNKGWEVAR